MKKTVLVFGIISGLISSILMVTSMHFIDDIGFDKGEIVGYTGMVISFLLIFFGIRSYRENNNGGVISFGKAFKIGALIMVVSCLFYVATWEVLYYNFMPDFAEKYGKYEVEQMRKQGASQEKLDKALAEMKDFKKMYDNLVYNAGITFLEPLPVGVVITLISAAILRKKKPAIS